MNVIFLRHATAEEVSDDGDGARRLTRAGHAEAKASANAIKGLGYKVGLILTSPLVRARQTAEAVAEAFPKAIMEDADELAPADPFRPERVKRRITDLMKHGVDTVVMVGHAPSIDQCVAVLTAGKAEAGISLSKAGAAGVELPVKGSPTGAELLWLMRKSQLAKMARS